MRILAMKGSKMIVCSFLLISLLSLVGQSAWAEESPDPRAAILRELREVREQLRQIAEKLREIRRRVDEAEFAASRPTSGGLDLAVLKKIMLPDNPTREQVRQYVIRICEVSEGHYIWLPSDPQAEMLGRVGRKWLPVLLDTWNSHGRNVAPIYLEHALVHIATEKDKQLIVEALPANHSLVRVISRKGWEAAAKDTLTSVLASRPNILHPDWIEATARLRDPNTYEDLMAYLVKGANPHRTYESIRSVPGLDVSGAVAEAWAAARSRRDSLTKFWIAVIAVEHGHLDALEYLVAFYEQKPKLAFGWQSKRAGSVIRSRASFSGPMEEVGNWFKKNKNNLEFDAHGKKFVVRGEEAGESDPKSGARK